MKCNFKYGRHGDKNVYCELKAKYVCDGESCILIKILTNTIENNIKQG